MLFSPLEQFNILSFFDFSLFLSFDLFLFSFFSFLSSFFLIFSSFFPQFIIDILSVLSFSPFIDLSSSLYSFSFFLIDFFFSFSFFIFSFFLSYLWSLLPSFSSFFFYSPHHLFFFFLPFFSPLSFLSFNLSFFTSSFFSLFSSFYFLSLDLFYSFLSLFSFFNFLFSFSSRDFSYLLFSFNLSTLWQSLVFFFLSFLFFSVTWRHSLTFVSRNSWQSLFEFFYFLLFSVLSENAGSKALKFFPLIFSTFFLVLFSNLLGMIPYSFTVTSHLIVTFSLAFALFLGLNILGIFLHRSHFLSLFFPPGAPMGLAPLLVLIEFVSYIFRVLSLSVRLFANLMSGHTLLKILASFSWLVVSFYGVFILPLIIIFIVTGLELAIAFLQAYIFSVLLCIYLNDAFNLH